jgi:hypothetical protein
MLFNVVVAGGDVVAEEVAVDGVDDADVVDVDVAGEAVSVSLQDDASAKEAIAAPPTTEPAFLRNSLRDMSFGFLLLIASFYSLWI